MERRAFGHEHPNVAGGGECKFVEVGGAGEMFDGGVAVEGQRLVIGGERINDGAVDNGVRLIRADAASVAEREIDERAFVIGNGRAADDGIVADGVVVSQFGENVETVDGEAEMAPPEL